MRFYAMDTNTKFIATQIKHPFKAPWYLHKMIKYQKMLSDGNKKKLLQLLLSHGGPNN